MFPFREVGRGTAGMAPLPPLQALPTNNAQRKTSLQDAVKSNFCTYLRETTVHGFRYVADGKNCFERLFWIGFISAGFIGSGYMLIQSMNESYCNPILTTIDTTSVKNVPFPAITVDAGKMLNPWGYVEKIGDLVQMDCYHQASSGDCRRNTEKVKADFKDLFEGVVEIMVESFVAVEFQGKTLEELQALQRNMVFAKQYSGFQRDAATLAYIIQQDPKSGSIRYIKKALKIATAATFGQYSPSQRSVPFNVIGEAHVRPIFDSSRAYIKITDELIVPCLEPVPECRDALAEAYKIILPIFRLILL